MIYGWCLGRVVHFIVALRAEHPDSRIFIAKYDFSDAYRRVAHTAGAAPQTILVMGQVAYIMLRLAFGGSPNPPAWCTFFEMVTDLANEIPLCPSWDPSQIRSPTQNNTPSPRELPDDIQLARACPTAVHIPTSVTVRTDCFIDGVFGHTPTDNDNHIQYCWQSTWPTVPTRVPLSQYHAGRTYRNRN
jgi:hypothetical protein